MIQKDKTYNLATFFCLYIAQTIPMSFFSTVIPVMMRQENFGFLLKKATRISQDSA